MGLENNGKVAGTITNGKVGVNQVPACMKVNMQVPNGGYVAMLEMLLCGRGGVGNWVGVALQVVCRRAARYR